MKNAVMNPEVLVEKDSKAMRNALVVKDYVLDKVKFLSMLPDGQHVTLEMVGNYYEVPIYTVRQLANRHSDELKMDGLKVLAGEELKAFKLTIRQDVLALGYQKVNRLTLIPRRAILRIGMLLRDSEVAKTVRSYLLNVEEQAPMEMRTEAVAALPGDFEEALEQLLASVRREKALQLQLVEQQPKVESYEVFLDSKV